MAEVRPLPGIRYAALADLAALVAPPYDVITPEAQRAYHERHPNNIIRIELGADAPDDDTLDNRYTRAAQAFAEWRLRGVLRQDAPALYLYQQRFHVGERTYERLSLLARVRLEPWSAGVILPHERTLSAPKEDRLRLTRAVAANVSPILALYDDPTGALAARLREALRDAPATAGLTTEASGETGEGHRLWVIPAGALADAVAGFFSGRELAIADGHHRYETMLAYRDEIQAQRGQVEPEDAVNYTLMALTAVTDPGLVIMPTHRVVRGLAPEALAALPERLAPYFAHESLPGDNPSGWLAALGAATAAGGRAVALITPGSAALLRLRPEGARELHERAVATGRAPAWEALDVAALHVLLLDAALGIAEADVETGGAIRYTRSAEEAVRAVRAGVEGAQLALLLNPLPPGALLAVARAGERMPQKSTYFYPKLLTGLVINPLW